MPISSTKPIEPAREEARVLPMPTGEETSEADYVLPVPSRKGNFEVAAMASIEPIIIIF